MLERRLLGRLEQKKEALDALRPLPSGVVRRLNALSLWKSSQSYT